MPAKHIKASAKATKKTSSSAKAKKAATPAAKKAPALATKPVAKIKKSSANAPKPIAPAKAAKPKARAAAKSAPTPKAAPSTPVPVITRDMIATRAYFIGERRQSMGWAGDSSTDWIEAESQVIAEAKRKRKY